MTTRPRKADMGVTLQETKDGVAWGIGATCKLRRPSSLVCLTSLHDHRRPAAPLRLAIDVATDPADQRKRPSLAQDANRSQRATHEEDQIAGGERSLSQAGPLADVFLPLLPTT
jgi:hypothetical protein